MNKRITSLLLCVVMVVALLATAVPTLAASTHPPVEVSLQPDKKRQHPEK